jgi:hypothetical protein
MSALGQKQTSDCRLLMSALPPKADIAARQADVRFVPKADISPQRNSAKPTAMKPAITRPRTIKKVHLT